MKHAMHWIYDKQRYGCSCGAVLYEGGEHKAREQHWLHKNGLVTDVQVITAVLNDPGVGHLSEHTQSLLSAWLLNVPPQDESSPTPMTHTQTGSER